jgi:hypothetical protein
MGILLAFAPFIAFALFDPLIGATEGLLAMRANRSRLRYGTIRYSFAPIT